MSSINAEITTYNHEKEIHFSHCTFKNFTRGVTLEPDDTTKSFDLITFGREIAEVMERHGVETIESNPEMSKLCYLYYNDEVLKFQGIKIISK